ncbi:UNVERIFIED_CONTAM: hypothetical protein Slati_0160200 [Sesamum latifolium]|uniref:DUF4283 domain-containing protein n=1 Tax=Sesamum latifolium TaxID=2727402 RepID=A0AAW2YAQ2_9LAMI
MEEVIEGGAWFFQGQPIVLQRCEPGMVLPKHKHTQVPVWIIDGLSTVESGISRPLYPDAITIACKRLDFACVCGMLDISSRLPKHIVIMSPNEDGMESPCKVDVEYEWVSPKCNACTSLGHSTAACPTKKQTKKAPVSVYVPRPLNPEPVPVGEPEQPMSPDMRMLLIVHEMMVWSLFLVRGMIMLRLAWSFLIRTRVRLLFQSF